MDIPPSHDTAARLYGPEFALDPAAVYERIRKEHGAVAPALLEGDVPVWLVLGYREVHQVLSDPLVFSHDSREWNLWGDIPPEWPLLPFVTWGPSVVFSEGEEHERRATAISDVLEEADHADEQRICQRTADQLIDEFAGEGKADLIAQYAQQLPIRVLARLFGLPESEAASTAADVLLTTMAGTEALAAHERILNRFSRLIAEHRTRRLPGLTARLVRHPAQLGDEELTMDMFVMMLISQQPLTDWIGNTLRLMLVDKQFSLTLQGGRSSVDRVLNEVLWKDTPIQLMLGRWATRDSDLGGRLVRKGDMLVCGLASANADPHVRPLSPASAGTNRAHLSFAAGRHACPAGAPEIAEVIARTAIEVLLDRIPDVRLAVPEDEVRWKETPIMRGLEALPVAFTPMIP